MNTQPPPTSFTTELSTFVLSTSTDGTIKIWDFEAQSFITSLVFKHLVHGKPILAILKDSRIVSYGADETLAKVTNVSSGSAISVSWDLQGHKKPLTCVAASPILPLVATASLDNNIILWDIPEIDPSGKIKAVEVKKTTQNAVKNPLKATTSSAEAENKSAGTESSKKSSLIKSVLLGNLHYVTALAFNPKFNLLCSGSKDASIRLFDTKAGYMKSTFGGHEGPITCLSWINENTLASGSKDKTVRIWDTKASLFSRQCLQTVHHSSPVLCMDSSAESQMIATGTANGMISLYDSVTRELLLSFTASSGPITCLSITPRGDFILSGSLDGTISLWDEQGVLIGSLKGHNGPISCLLSTEHLPVLVSKTQVSHPQFPAYLDPSPQGERAPVQDDQISSKYDGKRFLCPICHLTIVDTHKSRTQMLECCSSPICTSCYDFYRSKSQNNCPSCSKKLSSSLVPLSNEIENQIRLITMLCPYSQVGCSFVGHLNQITQHQSKCLFQPAKCPFIGCESRSLILKDLESHTLECAFRTVECSNDGCTQQLIWNKVEKHITNTCKYTMIDCPNKSKGCSCVPSKRGWINSFMRANCNQYGIPCSSAHLGCTFRMLPSEKEKHLSHCSYHELRDYIQQLIDEKNKARNLLSKILVNNSNGDQSPNTHQSFAIDENLSKEISEFLSL